MDCINVKIPVSVDDIDQGKVLKLVKKFAKYGEKLEMRPEEVGAAISILQDHYFDCYGAIPISMTVADAIANSRTFELKEV